MNDIAHTSERNMLKGFKVCMVAPYLPRKGGVTIQTHLMVDGLESEGAVVVRVDTILHKLSNPLLLPLRMILQPVVTAYRFLRDAPKCDVVHLQVCSWWGYLPVIVCVPLNRMITRKRLVISFHCAQGHLWIRKFAWLARLMRHADSVVVVSPLLKETFAKYGIDSEVLWNLVNTERFHFKERNEIRPNIVWIRHFEDMYDPITALKVYDIVKQEIPEATITFIGDGSLKPRMDSLIHERGLRDVKFVGKLKNEDVPPVFDAADIFLNTSKNDGLPTALLEASSSGLPIVTTDPGGIPDLIDSGVNGVLVPIGDIEGLAREVIGLVKDPEKAIAMGKAARENAMQFSWERCARELLVHYGLDKKNSSD